MNLILPVAETQSFPKKLITKIEIINAIQSNKILQAVQGYPPNIATGLVGAVGQIHLICKIHSSTEINQTVYQ